MCIVCIGFGCLGRATCATNPQTIALVTREECQEIPVGGGRIPLDRYDLAYSRATKIASEQRPRGGARIVMDFFPKTLIQTDTTSSSVPIRQVGQSGILVSVLRAFFDWLAASSEWRSMLFLCVFAPLRENSSSSLVYGTRHLRSEKKSAHAKTQRRKGLVR